MHCIIISGIRADSELLKSAVIDVNNVLRDSLPQDVLNFVEHSNITNYHLNNSRLHLNQRRCCTCT